MTPGCSTGCRPTSMSCWPAMSLSIWWRPRQRFAARLVSWSPGGDVVSLPNVAHADVRIALAQGRWEYRPWGLLDRTHLRFFTRASIVAHARAGRAWCRLTSCGVIVPVFESELALDRDTVPTELIDLVLSDPEAETYQFVMSAVREDEEHHLRRAHERVSGLEAGLARSSIAAAAARAELDGVRAELIGAQERDGRPDRTPRRGVARAGGRACPTARSGMAAEDDRARAGARGPAPGGARRA